MKHSHPANRHNRSMTSADHFHSLVESHRDRVYRFCFYYLGRGEDAEDVTQEVFIRLWSNLGNVSPAKIPAWINRVTRNACIDVVRRKISYRKVVADHDDPELLLASAPDTQNDSSARIEAADLQRELLRAIQNLAEPYRSVLLLREVEDLPYNEIAEALEMPLNTVKVYVHRGRRALREQLKEKVVHGDL
jgi:RNA polymerase sigma-70 factor (ECF subfamily)